MRIQETLFALGHVVDWATGLDYLTRPLGQTTTELDYWARLMD